MIMKIIKDVKIKTKICTVCNNYTGCGSDSDNPCSGSITG